ncbi:hypothetical protein AGMMS50256_31170 [Betaproteobacteria bacterium]|nr:hypothetical protein AGMMS50256_31170 [Betaproteobacteria bacterium]
MAMIPIYHSVNPADLALAESLLTAGNIPCFAYNRHFGGLYPGLPIESLNVCTLMVPQEAASDAHEILKEMIDALPDATTDAADVSTSAASPRPGFWQGMRMATEFFIYRWLSPAKSRRPEPDDDNSPE